MIKLFFIFFISITRSDAHQIKVAILDTGISNGLAIHQCQDESVDFTGKGLEDHYMHGTMVSSTIEQEAGTSDYCQVIVKYMDNPTDTSSAVNYHKALEYIASLNDVDIVNLSLVGPRYSKSEYESLLTLQQKHVIIIAASGNSNQNLDVKCNAYPACLPIKNLFVVGNRSNKDLGIYNSNYGSKVDLVSQGNEGMTSKATAIVTGKVIKAFNSILKRLGK